MHNDKSSLISALNTDIDRLSSIGIEDDIIKHLNSAIEILIRDEHLLSIKCAPDVICKQNDSDCLWCRPKCEDRIVRWS